MARRQGFQIEHYMNIPDLEIFKPSILIESEVEISLSCQIQYDDHELEAKCVYVTEAVIHEAGAFLKSMEKIQNHRQLLICLNARWLSIVQDKGWYVYNCHPTPLRPGANIHREPAALIRFQSLNDLVDGLLHFGAIQENFKGWASIYTVNIKILNAVN